MNGSPTNEVLDAAVFLELLHGKEAAIYFQVASKTWKNKPQTFRQAEPKLRWRNDQGDDIAFVVNTGGTKDSQIVRFNAVFIDWDCGRDQEGRYWPLDYVAGAKDAFMPKLTEFSPAPSIVVETRNGYHAYWLLKENVIAQKFRDCQIRLAKFFGSDAAIINPARVMRLPGFNWMKPHSGYEPFSVRIISGSDIRYGLDEIVQGLPVEASEAIEVVGHHFEGTVDCDRICAHNRCKSSYTFAPVVGAYPDKDPHQGQPVVFSNANEALEYLKKQDLLKYLTGAINTLPSQSTTITCPFHADTHPSASVYRNDLTGHWLFKCHSTICGVEGSIIDLAKRKNGFNSNPDAFKHLLGHYQVTIQSGWREAQVAQLDRNIAVLSDAGALKAKYPSLYRLIGRIRLDLIYKLNWFRDHVLDERRQVGGQAIFFASLRHFHRLATRQKEHPRYFNRQNEKVDRYCLLGLLRKIPDAELPKAILIDERKKQQESGHSYRVQYYSVPPYTDGLLGLANERACKLIDAGASVRGVSRELITDLFGSGVAGEIYPQMPTEPKDSGGFAARLSKIVLEQVSDNGYTTIKGLRLALKSETEWKSVTERRIEKSLPGIIARHRLKKVTCDGALKASLGISALGYPKVIIG